MNVWLVGDMHFGVHVNSLQWLDISKKFVYNFLIPHLKKHMGPDDVLIQLGDVFENRQHLNINIMNQAIKVMRDLSDVIPVHIIAGNHDAYYLDNNSVTSIEVLDGPNITTYKEPDKRIFLGRNWLMLPWERDNARIEEILKENSDCKIVVGHFDTAGFTFDNSRPIYGGIDGELMKKFEAIFLGHIHWRQRKNNILYTGTPYQTTRGDIGNTKGIFKVFESSGGLSVEFFENTVSPTFVVESIYELLEKPANSLKHHFDNTFLDIQLNKKFSKSFDFIKILEFFQKYGVETVRMEFPSTAGDDNTVTPKLDVNSNLSLTDIAIQVLQNLKYNKKEIEDGIPYFNELQIRAKDGKD